MFLLYPDPFLILKTSTCWPGQQSLQSQAGNCPYLLVLAALEGTGVIY